MRRFIVLVVSLVALLGLTLVATTTAASAATSKTYTATRTVGPFNGEATWKNNLPGGVDTNGEAYVVMCQNATANGDSIISGSAKINRKTSHGTASSDVLTLDPVGVFWDSEVDLLKWGVFLGAKGRKGWNSVTLTVTCRRH